MFGAFLLGFVGWISALIGFILIIVGFFSSYDAMFYFFLGGVMFVGGLYMRYISNQTNRSIDITERDTVDVSLTEAKPMIFDGEPILTNDAYKLHLVEKYSIKKNETLGKYVFNQTLHSNIDAALEAAAEHEKTNGEMSKTT